MKTQVNIVEDNQEVRQNLTELLNLQPHLECLATYDSGEAALIGFQTHCPDVVLMDIGLPGMSGIECTARLKELHPKTRVIMLTSSADNEVIIESFKAGANGYLLKNTPVAKLIKAITDVSGGGLPMTGQIARRVIETFRQTPFQASEAPELTACENEMLQLLAKGYAHQEIITQLNLSADLSFHHFGQIHEKIYARHRSETAAKYFNERGK